MARVTRLPGGSCALVVLLVLSTVAGVAVAESDRAASEHTGGRATVERAAVDEGGDPAVSLASDTVRVERGETVQITVELDGTDTGYLVIGAAGDPPYRNVFELTDTDGDGEVTVRLDTDDTEYVPPRGADDVDDVDDDTALRLPKHIPSGEYDLRVAGDSEAARSDPHDTATLHVERRPTAGVRLWRLDGVKSNASSGTVRQAMSTENLSRPLTIGPDEWLVAEVDDARVEDVLANRSGATPTERFVGAVTDDELEFDVRQTDTNVPQLDPKRLNLTAVRAADALVVVPKRDSGGYYVALDTGAGVLDRGGGRFHSLDFEFDEHYELTYTAPREDPTNTEAKHSASGTFDTHQTRSSLDRDRWTFEAAENQSITGETNLDPGTEVMVRIESEDRNNPLVDRKRVAVRENGTFAAQFDLRELPSGTILSILLTDPSGVAARATGRVVAQNESVALADDTVRVEQGGTARITVELTGTDTGYLRIGRESSSSSATVRLRDVDGDGAVTVWFDTFAPVYDENVVAASGTDEASLAGEMEFFRPRLLAGEYELITATDRAAVPQNSSDRGTLNVTSRSTDGVRLWRLDGVGPNASSGAVESAMSDRKFSQLTAFWPEGWLVVSVEVPGITEVVADRPESTPTERFTGALADGDVRFHVAQRESNVPQAPPKRLNVTKVLAEDALVVVPKQRTDGYYVALNATAPVLDRGLNRDSVRFWRGEVYDLWVAVPDGPLTDAGAGGSAGATFATRDRPVSLDRNVWTLEAAENQSITGTTPVAPWREVTVRIQSQNPNPLVDRQRVQVHENGTFTAQFDLSSLPPGTNVSIDAGNDTAVGRIPGPSRFVVSDLGAPETASPGETVAVAATVTNAGDRAGETNLTVGTGDWTPANRTVALGPGESTTVSLRFDLPETTPERTYDFAIETANGSVAFELDVVAETTTATTATTASTATETETATTPPSDPTSTPGSATAGDATTASGEGGLSGFTPAVVLVAVSATVLALRRRS